MLAPTDTRLSLSGKRWITPSSHYTDVQSLIEDLKSKRGIVDKESITHPSVFPDCKRAVQRIQQAIQDRETIGLFGDYDCDGVTSIAQLVRYFRRQNIEPYVRLPHRVHDGYGLQDKIVREIIEANVTLLITADTGIASVTQVRALKDAGVDVIVTDHHQPQQELPPAYAIIHPSLSPQYPLPHPSGSGVVFQLLRALENGTWDDMDSDRALAMMGTVADLVPLTGDNRTLTLSGLRALNRITHGPLMDLKTASGCADKDISSSDIGFRIAPRINAAGRLDDPSKALHALLEGGTYCDELSSINTERQGLTRSLVDEMQSTLETEDIPKLLMECRPDFHHGIIGLIAGQMTQAFHRPSCIGVVDGNTCVASLRSPSYYNITEGLTRCSQHLLNFGGHAQAAGCTFETTKMDDVRNALMDDIQKHCNAEDFIPTLHIDAVLDPSLLTLETLGTLGTLAPYGQGNPEPLFLLTNVTLKNLRCVGAEGNHLQAQIVSPRAETRGIQCIGFGLGSFVPSLNGTLDIACRIGRNAWNGRESVQVVIEDIRLS